MGARAPAGRLRRIEEWPAAGEIGCQPGQLTALKTASFATNMKLAMRATQWLDRPAADFIHPARW